MLPPRRSAELLLVASDGHAIGRLPPFHVESPWWPEVAPIVRTLDARYGLGIVVLRIVDAERALPPGGRVTYAAEVADAALAGSIPGLLPVDRTRDLALLADDPLRMAWARPGGPKADLAWASAELEQHAFRRAGEPEQVRTWNLSSLWRIPLVDGHGKPAHVWLKHVPPFFAHEGAVIERVGADFVPDLIAAQGARTLMREIPGEDMYEAGPDVLAPAVRRWVSLQAEWPERIDELLALGLPDWRGPALTRSIEDVVARTPELPDHDRATLDAFIADLPRRFREIAACGIPDTLVHGDFGPGNLRGDREHVVLLDWGDSGIGHPLLDQAAMLDRAPTNARAGLAAVWQQAWREAVPQADVATAARLIAPVAAARQAVVYRGFLDRIEASEHPYHRADPADWLGRTAAIVRAASPRGA